MFDASRRRLIVFLGGALCLAPAAAGKVAPSPAPQAPAQVLGQIVKSSAASIGGVLVPGGGTLLSGDTLSTSAGGGALVKFSRAGQVELEENSSVSFSGTPAHVVARITRGTAVVQTSDQESLAVETPACAMHSAAPGGAVFSVTVSSPASASITARKGSVSLTETASGKAHLLAAGSTSACPNITSGAGPEEGKLAPGERAGQAPPAAGPAAGGSSHTGLLLVVLGVGAAAGVGAALAGGHGGGGGGPASPSAP